MDLVKIIGELRREHAAVNQTLAYLEQVARAQGKRRGRPPAFLAQYNATRKPFSEATKKKMAAAQKKRWAAYRKQKGSE
jgi:hypothetical protein